MGGFLNCCKGMSLSKPHPHRGWGLRAHFWPWFSEFTTIKCLDPLITFSKSYIRAVMRCLSLSFGVSFKCLFTYSISTIISECSLFLGVQSAKCLEVLSLSPYNLQISLASQHPYHFIRFALWWTDKRFIHSYFLFLLLNFLQRLHSPPVNFLLPISTFEFSPFNFSHNVQINLNVF